MFVSFAMALGALGQIKRRICLVGLLAARLRLPRADYLL